MNSVHAHCAKIGSARNARRASHEKDHASADRRPAASGTRRWIQTVLLALPLISLLSLAPLTAGSRTPGLESERIEMDADGILDYYVHSGFP